VKAEVEVFWGGSGEGRGRTGVVEVNGGRQTKPRKKPKKFSGFFFSEGLHAHQAAAVSLL
jgi:hypothetical protein